MPHPVISEALRSAPRAAGVETPLQRAISLRTLLPNAREADGRRPYVNYSGSLTTPPCSTGVDWYVFLDPLQVRRGGRAGGRVPGMQVACWVEWGGCGTPSCTPRSHFARQSKPAPLPLTSLHPPSPHPLPPLQVDAEQIVDFMYYAGSGARPGVNARPPQPIGDRKLKYYAA